MGCKGCGGGGYSPLREASYGLASYMAKAGNYLTGANKAYIAAASNIANYSSAPLSYQGQTAKHGYSAARDAYSAAALTPREEFTHKREITDSISKLRERKTLAEQVALAFGNSGAALEKGSKLVKSYIAVNEKYSVAASEGFISEEGLGYINLSITRERRHIGGYSVLIKYDKNNGPGEVKEDKRIAEQLESILDKLTRNNIEECSEEFILTELKNALKQRSGEEEEMMLKISKEEFRRIIVSLKRKRKGESRHLAVLIDKRKEDLERGEKEINKAKKERTGGKYIEIYNPALFVSYSQKQEMDKNDFTKFVPSKTVQLFPKSVMGGVLGFTYLGDGFMGLRDDLYAVPDFKQMVDVHECIHTEDEYETRVLTDWILSKEARNY